MKKKLVLKKLVIVALNDKEQSNVIGGANTRPSVCRTCNTVCETYCGRICR